MISEDERVICPLWKYRSGNTITCEGPLPGTTVIFNLSNKPMVLKQTEIFCCRHWLDCEITRMYLDNRTFEEL